MIISSAGGGVPANAKTFLGHPRGLYMLFFAEMWERFSYYGMRAILVFYLTKHFLLGDQPSYAIYGAYTALVYITPVIGGMIADRYLGARKAVLAGGAFIAFGHLLIALVEGPHGMRGGYLGGFYLALAAIIVGTGFLKGNISVLVGQLYARDDMRRDPAFSIFYMGINLGGFLGPIVVGYLGERVGWSWGFGAAGIGMILGLVVFVLFQRELHGAGEPPSREALKAPVVPGLSREWATYLAAALGVLAIGWVIQYQNAVGWALVAFALVTFVYVLYRAVATLPRVERNRVFAALYLIALCPLFWALFEQQGSSLNIFTDRSVDRVYFGWEVPASLFQSINSVFIILCAPMFAGLWTWLNKRDFEPTAAFKFGIGLILVGVGFFAVIVGAGTGRDGLTPAMYVILLFFFHSAAELCFSPVGLSSMTRLSIPSMTGLMMGSWFLAMAAGNFLAGLIAQATGAEGAGVEGMLDVYAKIGWWSIGIGVIALAAAPFVTRLMHLDSFGEPQVDHALAGEGELAEGAAAGLDASRGLKA
ncbi:peptide MFS transporter [Sphingomonas sp. DT-204]|uniref:peptide MFS transporter n=1 Tax=Sphingomonas sp. DT-204 TaxID=3396166 RepID=UPI003F19D1B4